MMNINMFEIDYEYMIGRYKFSKSIKTHQKRIYKIDKIKSKL